MPKVLITGNAGFIGSNLADYMLDKGFKVYGIDNLSTGKIENVNKRVKFYKIDLLNYNALTKTINKIKPTWVFHLAAMARIQPSIKDPLRWHKNNATATLYILEACRSVGSVKKFIYSSSSSVYGDNKPPFKESQKPQIKHPYGLAKFHGEQWCELYFKLYGLDTAVLRYFNVYGKRQILKGDYATVVGIFIDQKLNNKPLTIVGNGNQKRDLTYIKDVVEANIAAARHEGFGIYNIGTGKNYRIKDVARLIQPDKSKHQFGLIRKAEAKITLADNTKAKKELNWQAKYSLEKGIKEIIGDYK